MAKKKASKVVPKEEPKEPFEVKAAYSPYSAGFLWSLHKNKEHVVNGVQPYETMELAVAAAHDFLKSI